MNTILVGVIILVIIVCIYNNNNSDVDTNNNDPELFENMTNDIKEKKIYENPPVGMYGGVPVYMYSSKDDLYAPEWRGIDNGIVIRNSKMFAKEVNTPREEIHWRLTGQM